MRKTTLLVALLMVVGLTLVQVGCSSEEDDPVTPPAECSPTVTTPQGGDSEDTGTAISINWAKITGDSVMIELFKGDLRVGTIKSSTLNDGFYSWRNSTTFGQGTGADYAVKVTNLKDLDCFGQSGFFELLDVSNCSIQFPWTTGLGPLQADTDFEITWTSEHTHGTVDLELWYEPFASLGKLVGEIDLNIPDNGSYMWKVDSFHRGTDEGYRFKIRDSGNGECNDTSIPFKLVDEVNCSIKVMGINGGHTYFPDEVIPIAISFENPISGLVDMQLYSGNEVVTRLMITEDFDPENGTVNFPWTVTDFGHTGPAFDKYNIRAWDSDDEKCVGQSDYFGITQ